jgi:lipopolysaccharide/colanic/teichoic acid biosynthesis glycosyltransferase
MEPDTLNEVKRKNAIKKTDPRRRVHVHSKRYRLADVEGLSIKTVLDSLVLVGIFGSDKTSEIKEITFSQEQIGKTEIEETIITIYPVEIIEK